MANKRVYGVNKIGALMLRPPEGVADEVVEAYRTKFTTEGNKWIENYKDRIIGNKQKGIIGYVNDKDRQDKAVESLANWYNVLKTDVAPKLVKLYAEMRAKHKNDVIKLIKEKYSEKGKPKEEITGKGKEIRER
jgi:hypothetical protein